MRQSQPRYTKLRIPALCVLAALLCSCAATTIKKTWKSPEHRDTRFARLAVIVVDERGFLRQGFENRYVNQLQNDGATGYTTFNLLPLPEINQDKAAAAEKLKTVGAQAAIVMRLMDITTIYHESRPGSEQYADVVNGFEMGTWYNYWTIAYQDMSPTFGNLKQKIYLETSIFDLNTAKRVWSGLSQTTIPESMDRVAEMDEIVAKFLTAMRRDGMSL
jgi:hypothetical protein